MTNAIIITFIIFILNNYYKLINCQNCTYENIENNIRYFDNSVLFINKNSTVSLNVEQDYVNFIILGDWGGKDSYPYRTILQKNISLQMAKTALLFKSQYQLTLGDNFYGSGVYSIDDLRFQRTFENVYDNNSLRTPWFNLLGDHDHEGNITAQFEYTYISKRWILPNHQYKIDIRVSKGSKNLIEIIVIDTYTICSNNLNTSKSYLNFIEMMLKNASKNKTPYVIVAGHYPIWSTVNYEPNKCLIQKLRPLLHHYKVNAYISGHDHSIQHITDTYLESKIEYIVCGSGAYINNDNPSMDISNENFILRYKASVGGYAIVEANNFYMNVTFIDSNGAYIYNFTISRN